MVTDVHDGHTHGPLLTDAEQLSLLLVRRLDGDADRLLLLSFVWAGQVDRFRNLQSALDAAAKIGRAHV